ncbi:lamin tail domain-containing protein [bacterium]|nr:lamin tail domain-containing protein [bacterium]
MRFLSAFLAVALSSNTAAEIRINELAASNVRSFPNAEDFEDYPDWIELFNSSSKPESLNGYYLSDNPEDLKKWPFPRNSTINPFEHLVIVADGYDKPKGMEYSRNYVGGKKFTTQFHHTNFKLSSSGEKLFLSHDQRKRTEVFPRNSNWTYFDKAFTWTLIDWQTPKYDDSSWKTGNGIFGHGDPKTPNIETPISFDPDLEEKAITTYFRQEFTLPSVPAGGQVTPISFSSDFNDAVVIHLNGKEILRDNLPDGPITKNTLAVKAVTPFTNTRRLEFFISADQLIFGENVWAIEVHQADATSDDLFFDFHYLIEVTDPNNQNTTSVGSNFGKTQWSYLDGGVAPPPNWTALGFDDSPWKTGQAPLGYFDENENIHPFQTETSFGEDPNQKIQGTYFRKNFTVGEIGDVRALALTYLADDGVVFYLNGAEIHKDNFNPTLDTELNSYQEITLAPDHLQKGVNTIAAFATLAKPTSPALRFDASLEIELGSTLTLVDHISFDQQVDDISYGRSIINPEAWIFMAQPTPGKANRSPIVSKLRETSASPTINPAGGLYERPLTLSIASIGEEIRFTTDGSNPTPTSALYTEPIELNGTTVVRARTFGLGKVPSQIITHTYFVGESFEDGLPIISVTAPDDTLFDPKFGIYGNRNTSGGNIHKGVDAPGNLEFFPADGSNGFSINGGFRLGGENNFLAHAQKALNFTIRGRYGDDALNYDLFPESGIGTFTSLTLREGGDDWGKAHLTDAIWNAIVNGRMEVETNRYRPAAMFINGNYWGLYNIRDRWDENWFFQEYGINNGEYDHIRFDRNALFLENGKSDDWRELFGFLTKLHSSNQEAWEVVESEINIDSLVDFTICETFGGNTSWQGNREAWQDNRRRGKWRWLLPDMDRTLGNTSSRSNVTSFITGETTVSQMHKFPNFRNRLAQRSAAHFTSTLSADRLKKLIDKLGATAAPEIPRQLSRWSNPTESNYTASLERMKNFVDLQARRFLDEIGSNTVERPLANLTLATTGEGSFRFAGVELETQTFKAFEDTSTEIEAIPAPGFRFERWAGLDGGAKTVFKFIGDTTLTAHFSPDSSTKLSGTLSSDLTLNPENSPYIITEDLIVPTGTTLSIKPGVTLQFQSGINLRVSGTLRVEGTDEEKVEFKGDRGAIWGGLSFEKTTTPSILNHLSLRNASRGKKPLIYPSAISGLDADIEMNFIDIGESRAPLFFQGGNIILRDSLITIPLTGDGLNVKQGRAETLRCTFIGNQSPDTDAIDYDGVIDGVIRDCRIYDFQGFNSDGIDIGEACLNCLIEGNSIFYSSDKGVSVGQGSTITLKNNLIVGCPLGIAVKDAGSSVLIDQNTIVNCGTGVAAYEKTFASGGGRAIITNSIFSNCEQDITNDSFSSITVAYSLSDTTLLLGTKNLLEDPIFANTGVLNFELTAESPARNAGDPQHQSDPDGTRADIGARYRYSPDDYPFNQTPTIVINEVLANSGDASDWIELHNRTNNPFEIGGWYLSDSKSNLMKFRIPPGTTIPPDGFLTFTEDLNFGEDSNDPGRFKSFALSDTGETVYLTSANSNQLSHYHFKEEFGPSLEGQTIGFHYKPSSDSYNFVPLETPTPGAINSLPKLGPIVISEIMYHGTVEYLELLNVSSKPIPLRDWKIEQGIEIKISSDLVINPSQRIILSGNAGLFRSLYRPEKELVILEWADGKLNNGGETVELERPGPLNKWGTPTFVRVDRVNYDNNQPWDIDADGTGLALSKIDEKAYGNDFINWLASPPSPGLFDTLESFEEWQIFWSLESADDNPDRDSLINIFEYAFDRNPLVRDSSELIKILRAGENIRVTYPLEARRPDLEIQLEYSPNLKEWSSVQTEIIESQNQADITDLASGYYRIRILKLPQ